MLFLPVRNEDAFLLPVVGKDGDIVKRTPLIAAIHKSIVEEEKERQYHVNVRPGDKVR